MGASSLALAVTIALSTIGQTSGRIEEKEVDYLNTSFQRWWGTDIAWRFDDLPTEGGVLRSRIPYTGHDYPDRAGGTVAALGKYDRAFHRGRSLATGFERKDTTSQREPTYERRGLFGMRRVRVDRTPGWHGHCNGWTAAAIRHAEPQRSVVRNGVVFTPADIKGLLAEIYMYSPTEFLGGVGYTVNPGTFHVVICNWIGRGSHPVGMETTPGEEKWNYPVYSYACSFAKRSEERVEVRMNVHYTKSTNREYQRTRHVKALMGFHYMLQLNEAGEIIGGQYYPDSAQLDMLWAPLQPVQGGGEENPRGNPHVDVQEVLAIWRESVPEDLRLAWLNIDPTEEDRVVTPGEETESSLALAPATDNTETLAETTTIAIGDILILDSDAATFWLPGREKTTLPRGSQFTVTEIRDEWIGGHVVLEGVKRRGWVSKSDIEIADEDIEIPADGIEGAAEDTEVAADGIEGAADDMVSAADDTENVADDTEIASEDITSAADADASTRARISTVNVGDTFVLDADTATFSLPGRTNPTLVRGTHFTVTEVRSEWIGGYVILAGVKQKGWIRRSDITTVFTPASSSEEN